jgi:anti-sigma28 factor (negative regulator of flagellin synthesis)
MRIGDPGWLPGMGSIQNLPKRTEPSVRQTQAGEDSKAKAASGAGTSADYPVAATGTPAAGGNQLDVSRAERIAELKRMFQAGKPIDVEKLADKLLESGLLFTDKG